MDKYYTTARHLRDLHFQNMPLGNEMINASPFSALTFHITLFYMMRHRILSSIIDRISCPDFVIVTISPSSK